MKASVRIAIIGVIVMSCIPSSALCSGAIKTGYDLYLGIVDLDDPKTEEDLISGLKALGYMDGILDGMTLMQDALYTAMFPKNLMSESEREEFAKKVNFHRLNMPVAGVQVGQFIMMYKKFAEENPHELNETARTCVFICLVKAYGWK